MLTEKDIDYIEKRLKEVFVTKKEFAKYRDELMTRLDKILKEVITTRQAVTINTHKITDHETRIQKTERKLGFATS